ncbi:hypothetical protein DL769_002401 [Monosporascus sp. CRB-8-3]|nr:hypothetical protein DL769_002401 [Monosporascus sp. CRB-8-3]
MVLNRFAKCLEIRPTVAEALVGILAHHEETEEEVVEALVHPEETEEEVGGILAHHEEGEEEVVGPQLKSRSSGKSNRPDPDKEVERIENKSAFEMKKKKSTETNPQRPGYGVGGKEVILWTNYFNLYSRRDLELYRYSVAIAADGRGRVPAGKRAKRIVQLLLEEHFLPHGHNIATDFKSNLISRDELDPDDEYIVTYRSEEEDVPAANATQFRCRIQFTGSLTLSELINHMTSTQAGLMFGSKDEIIQALNIVLGHHPKAEPSVATIAANRHFGMNATTQDRISLGAGLQVIRGFFMSVRAATARILVNVQVKNMAFYDEGPLDKIMVAFMSANGPNKVNLLKFVKKLSVDATHIVRTNSRGQRIPRIKTVQGFATKDDGRNLARPPIVPQFGAGAKEVQFFLDNSPSASSSKPAPAAGGGGKKGKKGVKAGPAPPSTGRYISVFDFFQETYNIMVKDPKLPVINVATKDSPSYLPAEVCEVRPGQPAGTKLSSSQTQQMIRFAGGRSHWRTDQDFISKLNEFQDKLRELGISVNNYMQGVHITPNSQQIESEIDHWIHRFAINPKRPKLILVIIPEAVMTAVYNRIKYICDVKEGILNVCVLDSKFSRANPQYLANVGLKFNLKLGGRNHSLDPSKLGFVGQKKTMVVGIDVTHPSPGSSSKAPSVAGIVASIDEWLGQWPADIRVQPARQEMVTDLDAMFKSRLLLWREKNKTLPENVLVYRDGVSEGQYDIVLDQELPALRAACNAVYSAQDTKAGKPRITIIIVGKRHNTRFYPTKKEEADRGGNPMNGTIVDRGVTEARNWDFFLQAHAAIQGTARPAHYYVVYDQIFRDLKVPTQFSTAADALEDLTHNMCYLFGRATKAVRQMRLELRTPAWW